MKRWVLIAIGLIGPTLGTAPALASGLNLGWGPYCPTNQFSVSNVSDPCDGSSELNGVVYTLVGSVRAPSPAPMLCVAEDFFIDIQENAPTLSDYWKLEDENQPGQSNVAGCRGANSVNGNVGSLAVQVSDQAFPTRFTGCVKFWGSTPTGSINYGVLIPDAYPGIVNPRRARLIGHFAKAAGSPMTAGVQYGVFIATIDTNHQIDDPSNPPDYVCAGCQDGVCLQFNEIMLRQPPGTPNGDITITREDVRDWVGWQEGNGYCLPDPVHRATWGQVKSLYR
jgi:hypothetical protein